MDGNVGLFYVTGETFCSVFSFRLLYVGYEIAKTPFQYSCFLLAWGNHTITDDDDGCSSFLQRFYFVSRKNGTLLQRGSRILPERWTITKVHQVSREPSGFLQRDEPLLTMLQGSREPSELFRIDEPLLTMPFRDLENLQGFSREMNHYCAAGS